MKATSLRQCDGEKIRLSSPEATVTAEKESISTVHGGDPLYHKLLRLLQVGFERQSRQKGAYCDAMHAVTTRVCTQARFDNGLLLLSQCLCVCLDGHLLALGFASG